jgi:hypothetical protein
MIYCNIQGFHKIAITNIVTSLLIIIINIKSNWGQEVIQKIIFEQLQILCLNTQSLGS